MLKTELVLFNKKETLQLLAEFGFKTKDIGGKIYLLDDENVIKTCDNCKRDLEAKKVGSIAHGSRKVYCDNPLCLSGWVAQNKI